MKFKKDNSAFVITQKMIDDANKAKESREKEYEEQQKKFQELAEAQKKVSEESKKLMNPIISRTIQYGLVADQLDRLWHDIDEGRIQADKTSANSWYGTIKSVKDAHPIDPDWSKKVYELSKQTIDNIQTANNV
jgi:hypothetical protein